MIPFKAEIRGFKRYLDASVLLDKKLIAFVGPNEAGKSSFFDALLSIEEVEVAYQKRELTKGETFDYDDVIVLVSYLLNKDEKDLIKKWNGKGNPRFFNVEKDFSGTLSYKLIGDVTRNKNERFQLRKLIKSIIESKSLQKKLKQNDIFDSDLNITSSLFDSLENFLHKSGWNSETLRNDFFLDISKLKVGLIEIIDNLPRTQKDKIETLLSKFDVVDEIEKESHPRDLLEDYLIERRPPFVFFGNNDRQLKGTYTLAELDQKPNSLVNLLDMGGVDIGEISSAMKSKETAERIELHDKLNKTLRLKFSDSWSQSIVYPRIVLDVDSIKVMIESSKGINELRDRSDGLRQFIAMRAFLEKKAYDVKPVLLIDEAEIHLHYNAQADLVSDFEQQQIVNSIFYTTHSAGCLPSDLGTGVRVVEPIYEDKEDTGFSKIRNSIWQNDGGFSPLLLAMGANVIAFTPTRKAIIAEGPSETILLPRILREASKKEYLNFQVAPGIATIPVNDVKSFELEAAKVAYLVDGDKGGDINKKKLIKGGIDVLKIVQLPNKYSIEDFLNIDILYESIRGEYQKMGFEELKISLEKIPRFNRIEWFQKKFNTLGNGFPSKVRVAESVVSNTPSDKSIIDLEKIKEIKEVYKQITTVLSI